MNTRLEVYFSYMKICHYCYFISISHERQVVTGIGRKKSISCIPSHFRKMFFPWQLHNLKQHTLPHFQPGFCSKSKRKLAYIQNTLTSSECIQWDSGIGRMYNYNFTVDKNGRGFGPIWTSRVISALSSRNYIYSILLNYFSTYVLVSKQTKSVAGCIFTPNTFHSKHL